MNRARRMSLAHPVVPRLDLDHRPSLADRIRAFKNSLSSGGDPAPPDSGTFRRSHDQYNSIDDIVSLLRTRAVESLPAEPSEEISSIIEELRSKNSDVSISSPPREITTAVRIVEKPPQVVNIEDLVRRLTVDDNDEDESPEKILARIKVRLEGTPNDQEMGISKIPTSIVSSSRVVIDSKHSPPHMLGVGIGPEHSRRHEMVRYDPLVLVRPQSDEEPSSSTIQEKLSPLIPDLVLLPHQLPYIEAETLRIRADIFRKIKLS